MLVRIRQGAQKIPRNMQIDVSKSNWTQLMNLIDKSVTIIQSGNPSNREYNVARQLRQTKKCIIRQIDKQNAKASKQS